MEADCAGTQVSAADGAKSPIRFYHAFPRPRKGIAEDQTAKGLRILKCMVNTGFLLTPEITDLHQSEGEIRSPVDAPLIQSRICFTAVPPGGLASHRKSFGSFALEYGYESFLRLGGLPVLYIPHDDRSGGFSDLGATLARDYSHVVNVLRRLRGLEELPNCEETQVVALGARNVVVKAEEVKLFLQALREGLPPFTQLYDSAQSIAHLFYPTDYNGTELRRLSNYGQQEWRISGNLSKPGEPGTRKLNDAEKEAICAVDPDFWSTRVQWGEVTFRFLDAATVLTHVAGRHVLSYARRVICPDDAVATTTELLSSIPTPPQVVPWSSALSD